MQMKNIINNWIFTVYLTRKNLTEITNLIRKSVLANVETYVTTFGGRNALFICFVLDINSVGEYKENYGTR